MQKAPAGKLVGICLALGKLGNSWSLNQNFFNILTVKAGTTAAETRSCENGPFISCIAPFAQSPLCNTYEVAAGKGWLNP